MSNSQEDKLEYLTEGSTWINAKGRTVTALLATNTDDAIPEKFKRLNPPQVVCISDQGQILSFPLDRFLETYEFHNVNADIEAKSILYVESLSDPSITLARTLDDETDDGDTEVEIEEDTSEDSDIDSLETDDIEPTPQLIDIKFAHGFNAGPVLDSDRLASLVESVLVSPQITGSGVTQRTVSRIAIKLRDGLTDDMHKLVDASVNPESSVSVFDTIVINGEAFENLTFLGSGKAIAKGLSATVLYFQEPNRKKEKKAAPQEPVKSEPAPNANQSAPESKSVQQPDTVQVTLEPVTPMNSVTTDAGALHTSISATEIPVTKAE